MFCAFSIYPLFMGIGISFTDFDILRPLARRSFVGFGNYVRALTQIDDGFYASLLFTSIYSLSVCILSYLLGLGLALALNKDFRFRAVFRGLFLLPWVIPPTVYATNWRWILNDRFGIVNQFLLNIGLTKEPILFLAESSAARLTVILGGTWRGYPFMMLVILAGLQSIPDEIYEAARIDGANRFQSFVRITFPLLLNVSIMSTILQFIWTFNNFENIYLLTSGGPINSTTVLSILIYNTAFFRGRFGYAAAIAVVDLILLSAVSVLYLRLQRQREG